MALDAAFQATTDAALLDMAQRPQAPKPRVPSFSIWGTVAAAPKGLAAGANEGAGSTADMLGAFGDVAGQLGDAGGAGMFGGISEKERKEANVARDKLLSSGPDYNSEGGRSFRNAAKDYMPDPVTVHAAEQGVANLFRLGGKAVAAGVTMGAVPGAVVAGLEEGFTTADALGQQGVDLATRTKVGGVTAAFTAASFAIPVAGPGVKSTVGLALAGGPLSFMGQNAATREILNNANYGAIANQYDPFDPVGLALSTLLPLGFGAIALRAGKGAKAGAKVDEAPPAVTHSDAEAVDAARVNLLRENVDNSRPTPAGDLPGAAAHDAAMSRAIDQASAGERVEVTDVAGVRGLERINDELAPRIARAVDEMAPTLKALEAEAAPVRVAAEPAAVTIPKAPEAPGPAAGSPEAAATVKLVSESPEIDRASNLIEAERPDLMVHLDGMDAPVKLSELMQRIREDLGRELQEAPLIEAAATCFIS